jgi:glycine C-acetyltransferase
MHTVDPRALNLADFYGGHDTDPLEASAEFVEWARTTSREQGLFQRPLAAAAGPRTRLVVDGREREFINLASLDYLGLNRHPAIAAAIAGAFERWGVGACGVPLLTGMSAVQRELETEMSAALGREDAMVFPSGFSGGVGLMLALLRAGDVAIADAKAHMCWLDGIRSTGAQLKMFPHGDLDGLAALLDKHRGSRRIVVVDGLYSMDGDVADLPAILDVCEAFGVGLVVDEAHSIFALGRSGGGATEQLGVEGRVRLLFGTFSKALAMLGGFASGRFLGGAAAGVRGGRARRRANRAHRERSPRASGGQCPLCPRRPPPDGPRYGCLDDARDSDHPEGSAVPL